MNKEKLLELSDTLRGIANGREYEVYSNAHDGEVVERCDIGNVMSWLGSGWQIRLKPQPDPYAELKAAHASGKTIQCNANSGTTWIDLPKPYFGASVENYRIKPEPQKLPLCADDVKAGDECLAPDGYRRQWEKLSDKGINFVWTYASWDDLATHGWKIRSIGETEWRPCYKLVEQ